MRHQMATPEAQRIADAWLQAGQDLGIEVISPFLLKKVDEQEVRYLALVPQFGSRKGMLLLGQPDLNRTKKAEANGFGYSCLSAHSYAIYDRALFVDTLNDWGWSEDQGPPPAWYTGEVWGID